MKCVVAVQQLLEYRNKRGLFAREGVQELAKKMQSPDWWAMIGTPIPELQLCAMRATACCSSASGAEHGHKEMNFIQSKSRNRLHFDKVHTTFDTLLTRST